MHEIPKNSFLQGQELNLLRSHVSSYLGRLKIKSVTVNGRSTRYLDGGAGPVVIFLHGLASNKTHFRSLMKDMLPGYRVIAPEIPGLGTSSKLEGGKYSLRNLSDWLNQFIEALGVSRVSLVGVSLSASLSAYYAYKYPDKVNKLCLLSMPESKDKNGCSVTTIMEEVFRRFDNKGCLDELVEICFYYPPNMHPLIRNKIFKDLRAHKQHFSQLLQDVNQGQIQLKAKLPHIRTPVLLICGDSDPISPISFANTLREQFPYSSLHVLTKSKHLTFLEKHEEVLELIGQFLG